MAVRVVYDEPSRNFVVYDTRNVDDMVLVGIRSLFGGQLQDRINKAAESVVKKADS